MKKFIILTIILSLIIIVGGFWFAGNYLISPANQMVGNFPDGLNCKNIEFESQSGATIKGWFLQGEKGKGAIVLMHGVRGNRLSLIDRIRFLNKAGYSILAFDFQAGGESTGENITFGYLESKDAEASVSFIKEKLPDEKIGVIGISMGGAAFLLSDEPLKVDALILEMVYPTMRGAVENRLNIWFFKGADNFAPFLTLQFPIRLGISVDDLRPVDKVKYVKMPILFIVGEKDATQL